MKASVAGCTAGVAVLSLGGAAAGETISFDDLGPGVKVTNQYASATFASEQGQAAWTMSFTGEVILCTGDLAGTINCTQNVYVAFTNPVNNLTFLAIEPNQFGPVATFRIYYDGIHTDDVDLIGLGANPGEFGNGNKAVDLSAYSHINRIEILGPGGFGDIDNSYGGNGIGWDNFSFDAVPAPGAAAVLALGALAAAHRRRM